MGLSQRVLCPPATQPSWPQLQELLGRCGFPVQLRMIDGQLAFPDEQPPDDWRELRIGTPQGMVTLQRDAEGLTLVTWGNADATLRQAWQALTWATAYLAHGVIEVDGARRTAAEHQAAEELPPQLRCP